MTKRPALTDRFQMIKRAFAQAFFGHVDVEMASWDELDLFCDNYLAGMAKNGDELEDATSLPLELLKVLEMHPLARFPVSKRQKKCVQKWIKRMAERNEIDLQVDVGDEEEEEEPEFIFKTFERSSQNFVTLLEENRDFIGHGTTGLTSWQGALFLADWSLNNEAFFKVRFQIKGIQINLRNLNLSFLDDFFLRN